MDDLRRRFVGDMAPRAGVGHDVEALALAIGVLGVLAALCLVSAIWPDVV